MDGESRSSLTGRSAEARLVALEAQRRRVDAEITALLDDVERSGAYTDDGHQSVRSWAMATTGWSRGEATIRLRVMHALRDLPSFAHAHATGTVPTGHLQTVRGCGATNASATTSPSSTSCCAASLR